VNGEERLIAIVSGLSRPGQPILILGARDFPGGPELAVVDEKDGMTV